ncbi:hypothetical protein [Candidatus Hydrogenosomobacter endosymbioticus]|uniref:Uncharacterized protein n=1 Tax=Candidatus Hydrogenosomobacter endosymbioticus TaxID=2558174 RepID=A0ABM7V825_9PROT|nr:hypothetical protein [Candidatus Hydrogenosomobacter endosymbioticus]BDB95919.1 hypothetical protein HYD_0520 [Candidatus Hydrogenosomobacter endosymbioticus]
MKNNQIVFPVGEEGYEAPSTHGENSECPIIEITSEDGVRLYELGELLPKQIFLSVKAVGVFANNNPSVQLLKNDTVFASRKLYSDAALAPVQYLDLMYEGSGTCVYCNGKSEPIDSLNETDRAQILIQQNRVIYRKPFAILNHDVVSKIKITTGSDVFIDPPGEFRVVVLYPYGGFFSPEYGPKSFSAMFFSILERQNRTSIQIVKMEEIKSDSHSGKFTFVDDSVVFYYMPSKEESISLADAINFGYVRIEAVYDDRKYVYKSCSYSKGKTNESFEVCFIPFIN